MKQAIAKFGYISAWAFGVPECSLEENLDGYFAVGMYWLAIIALALLVSAIALPIILKKEKKEPK
jgi:hypothetical protein